MNQLPKPNKGLVQMAQPALTASHTHQPDAFDLRRILGLLWRGKWIIAIAALMAATLAVVIVSQFEAKYSASAKVMFDTQKTNVANLQEVLIDQEFSNDTLQNQLEILRSTNLIKLIVEELNLLENPEFNNSLLPAQQTIFERFGGNIDVPPDISELLITLGILSAPAPPLDPDERARREMLNVIQSVRANLALRPIRGSRVIQISYTSASPRTAAQIVNSMADQYIVNQLESKLQTTRAATSWLNQRVAELQDRVEITDSRVAEARKRLSLEAGQGIEITNQQLEALNAALALARNKSSQVGTQYDRLIAALDKDLDLGTIPEFRESTLIQSYRRTESDLLSNQVRLKASVKEGHPSLVRLQAQIDEVKRNIEAEASRVVSAIKIDLDGLQAQERTLAADVRELETKALTQSANQVELRQLEREAVAARNLYESLLSRQQEASAQEDLQYADARVLSPAEIPILPDSAGEPLIIFSAIAIGAVCGIGIIFLLDRLNNTFRSQQQLEEFTGQKVLATIPTAGSRKSRSAVVKLIGDKPSGALAESVRNLRTSIFFSNIDNPPKVVMFTSSAPREGKSTTAMMTAVTSTQMGKSAIIVDCDLRMPALSNLMKPGQDQPGLLSVLEGGATLEDAILVDKETGLHVLMARESETRMQVSAADILASQKFQDLIALLAAQYDLVILDTPPTLVVTDARIVSRLVDAVVFAVRWDKTPRGAVIEGLQELESVGAPVIGVALTMINESRAAKYSYSGYGYYKGRYRDYYEA